METVVHPSPSLRDESKEILRLAGPLALAQSGIMTMGIVDTLIIGRYGAMDMAGVALGNGLVGMIFVFGIGVAMGVEPLVGQAFGAGALDRARSWMWQGAWLSLFLSVPLVIAALFVTSLLVPFGIGEELASRTTVYVLARSPGIPFTCMTVLLRSYLSNVQRTRPAVVAVVVANVLNAGLDYVLVFGKLGFPALGAVGVGLATSLCMLAMTLVLIWGVALERIQREGSPSHGFERPSMDKMGRVFSLGWPIGAQTTLEVGIFAAVSALIARFGEIPTAGHQIAISMASLSFMAAVGIANATTARVGFHVGADRSDGARMAGLLGIGTGGLFMAAVGVIFILAPTELARLFTNDPEVLERGAVFLRIAGIFGLSDGVQVVAAGALRGAGDTRWALYANFVSHWLVGLPVALYLGHSLGWGPVGYWWGLTAGLTVVAIALALRFAWFSARPLAKVTE